MGATLSYINGGDPLSGGSAAVAAEKAAQYLSQQYNDGQTAIDPQTGEFNPNLLPEHIKDEIKSTTGVIASIVGAAGDGGAALNAQIGGVVGQNVAENNWLHSQTAKQRGWLSKTEIELLDKLAKQSGARSIEYFIQQEQKIRQSSLNAADKEKALANLKREYEADSRKMEAAAAKLPKGSKEREVLFTAAGKMQGIVSVLPPYEKSEFVRAEQRDWLPTANPIIHSGESGFVAVQRQWAVNDGKTPEEARFQTEMTAGGRGGNIAKRPVAKPHAAERLRTADKPRQTENSNQKLDEAYFKQQYGSGNVQSGGGNRLETRERVDGNVRETRTHRSQTELARAGQLANELKKGKLPGTPIGQLGTPRTMPASINPNATAERFAETFLGRKPTQAERMEGAKMNNNNCIGCWRAQAADGTMVVYRPAGYAGKGTLPTTATAEIHHSETLKNLNNGRDLKLKFPIK
ncbi:hypothetical protein [Neisseria sp.]|uniref:hypothetical protein n=1 Tax=Neisseria sp. TaxID=192066 RepID=UPI0026DAA312|nr:hypothetical protein [Neisseria sp.]MDO4907528.1 hypothetical protein [Neisseria sp.]